MQLFCRCQRKSRARLFFVVEAFSARPPHRGLKLLAANFTERGSKARLLLRAWMAARPQKSCRIRRLPMIQQLQLKTLKYDFFVCWRRWAWRRRRQASSGYHAYRDKCSHMYCIIQTICQFQISQNLTNTRGSRHDLFPKSSGILPKGHSSILTAYFHLLK